LAANAAANAAYITSVAVILTQHPHALLLVCRAQVLSWQPRLLLHHNLLTAQECDALVALRTGSAQGTGVEQV
jgi:hypothetical protein